MKDMSSRFNDHHKALMLEIIIDGIVRNANELPELPSGFKSRDEYNGNIIRTTLSNNGFILAGSDDEENILRMK
jgi:hypothetical protein